MIGVELLAISATRAVTEVALLALLGQGAVALLAGTHREANPIYRLFSVITRPVLRVTRIVTPRAIIDRHLPFLAFFVLFWLWIILAYLKRVLIA